ncbi:uncharacterized protein LOC111868360 isoform X2 [Cryptotermes secundus]|uniref:uncharacterized protein LOC111868360 isoform X2 n=1 Tax=Cryptotermes secundus TaxID=105785 RepID=UPI001454C7A1|nr:uncharacterized protein LOC111868360 isoform X2 [Cryptotermes secundus]
MLRTTVGLLYSNSVLSRILPQQARQIRRVNLTSLQWMSSKDIMDPSASNTQDFLLQDIKSSRDTTQVLKIVGIHHKIMNNRHVMQSLKCLFELKKSGKCSMTNEQIVNSPDFIKLCKRLKSQARGITLNDTIQALKTVSFVGVPASSTIIQVLLQLIRQGVNDLSLHQIIFLEFMMRNFDRNPLVDALRIAFPLVFEAQLSLKMAQDDVTSLAELLQYACKKPLSDSSINIIIECLEKLSEDIDVKIAKSVMWSLCELRRPLPSYHALLIHCWNVITENIKQCSYTEIDGLLSWMVKKVQQKQTHFYHEGFADSCVRYVVDKDCGFEEGTWILRKLTRLGHINISLIDYIGEKIVNNPQIVKDCKAGALLSVVSGMAAAEYKPVGWNSIQEALMTNTALISKERMEFPWLRLALDFAVLDIFCPDLLRYVFDYNLLDNLQLLLLHQAVVTLYPSYSGVLPPQNIIDMVKKYNGDHVQQFPLQAALEKGLGGGSYVWTRLLTKLGHFIDHLVVMRKGGYPVALNQISSNSASKTYVEDLLVPSDSQIILVLCMPASYYAVNCQRLRPVPSLTVHTLEALGYSVVPVSLQHWMNLPDYEKIPYLMQNIKMKCESVDSNEASIVH